MFDALIHKISFKKALAIAIHFTSQDEYQLSYVFLVYQKDKIELKSYGTVKKIAELQEQYLNLPVFLNISGKVILEKEMPLLKEKVIEKAFPTIHLEDFYTQHFSTENNTWVSIIRKNKVDNIIEEIKESRLFPTHLSLGSFMFSTSMQHIESIPFSIDFFEQTICLENEVLNIATLEFSETTQNNKYIVDDKTLNTMELLAFSTALSYYVIPNHINIQEDIFQQAKKDISYQALFNQLKLKIPIFLFFILLVNALFFIQLNNKNEVLRQQYNQNTTTLAQLDTLKKEVEKKKYFLKQSKWLQQSKISYIADQIGASLPSSITLISLNIFPATMIKKNNVKDYQFDKNILIKGNAKNLTELNQWKQKLHNHKWIKSEELLFYEQINKSKAIFFELKISLE